MFNDNDRLNFKKNFYHQNIYDSQKFFDVL